MKTTSLMIKEDLRLNPLRAFTESDYLATTWEINEDIDRLLWLQTLNNKIKGLWKWILHESNKILLKIKSIIKYNDSNW